MKFISCYFLCLALLSFAKGQVAEGRVVVLTFDDAVESHRTFVAPLLRKYGFNATFFITYAWMEDSARFMNWQDAAALHQMGFEIGNHSWTHGNFAQPRAAYYLEGELGMVEWMMKQHGIPKPVSYAHTGNAFGPEAIQALKTLGYRFARRGKQPEVPYGNLQPGPGYDPEKHHPLLIPTTLDFYPGMNLDILKGALENLKKNEIAVLQFHGVPDVAHPWVNTPQEDFRQYLQYLHDQNCRVIAMKDLASYLPEHLPNDRLLNFRHPAIKDSELEQPDEVVQSQANSEFWLQVMKRHRYNETDIGKVLGQDYLKSSKRNHARELSTRQNQIEIWPYPGGKHPRLRFKEGMLSPNRGTKLSIFLPWSKDDYVVLDLPEAVFSQFGLTFLGHKHIPTIFDLQLTEILNSDWTKDSLGNWQNTWHLPNQLQIGAVAMPGKDRVMMRMWLTNHTKDTMFTHLQSQVCVMLGSTQDFASHHNEHKLLSCPMVAVRSPDGSKWIITGWQGCTNPWGNQDCPCLHADPAFPDCAPGQTVSLNGVLYFFEGHDVDGAMELLKSQYDWLH